jgi:hypothetical protein
MNERLGAVEIVEQRLLQAMRNGAEMKLGEAREPGHARA